MYINVRLYILYKHILTHIHTPLPRHAHKHTNTCTSVYILSHLYTHAHTHVHTHVRIHICIRPLTSTYTWYTYIFKLTYTCTHTYVLDLQQQQNAKTLKAGAELGVYTTLGFAFQSIGLLSTTAARSAFLLYLNVKIVPFLAFLLLGRSLSRTWTSAFLALAGTCYTYSHYLLILFSCEKLTREIRYKIILIISIIQLNLHKL